MFAQYGIGCYQYVCISTCTDAGPDLGTFCPDLCTLCLWCYPSINQCKYSTSTHGGGHWLQLALVVFVLQPLVQTLLAPVGVLPVATCIGGLFLPPTGAHTPLALQQLALCGGGMCVYIFGTNCMGCCLRFYSALKVNLMQLLLQYTAV